MADLAALKAKIAALRAKTTQNGCTEAEAMAAAELAARLLHQSELDEADMSIGDADVEVDAAPTTWRVELSAVIAHCTNCDWITRSRPGAVVITFMGREPGPEIAAYLRDVLFRAVDGALTSFRRGLIYASCRGPVRRRQASEQFCEAMARRLTHRLLDLFRSSIDPKARLAAAAALDRRFPNSGLSRSGPRTIRPSAAAAAGVRAGEAVPLHHGVAGSAGRSGQTLAGPAPRLGAPHDQGRLL